MNLTEDLTGKAERRRLFWKLQCGSWLALGLLVILFAANSYYRLPDAICVGLFRTALGFGISCVLWLGYRQLRQRRGNIWSRSICICFVCGLAGIVDGLFTGAFVQAIGVDLDRTGAREFLFFSPLIRALLYLSWSGAYFGITYWLDTQQTQLHMAQVEAAARTSELAMLRAQINPHFLFNALGSILAQSDNPHLVRQLTFALSDYLRFSLQQRGEWESLGVELKALENYLQVETTRFEENLEYRIDASERARACTVPNAIVQPLLENAIKYGQRSSIRPLRIEIVATVEESTLVIAVSNSGEWLAPEQHDSSKIGLSNLRRRLQLLYADKAILRIEPRRHKVCVWMYLPLDAPQTSSSVDTQKRKSVVAAAPAMKVQSPGQGESDPLAWGKC